MLILNMGNNVVNEIYEKMVPKCIDPDSSTENSNSNSVQCPFIQKAFPKCDKYDFILYIKIRYVSKKNNNQRKKISTPRINLLSPVRVITLVFTRRCP